MTDHDKLRDIVRQAHAFIDGARIGSMERYLTPSDLLLLADAAESTLPKTKMIEVWRVEFAQKNPHGGGWQAASASFPERAMADKYEWTVKQWLNVACIRVTGPHQQEVPA